MNSTCSERIAAIVCSAADGLGHGCWRHELCDLLSEARCGTLEGTRHPLGFSYVRLGATATGVVRLHVWPNGCRLPQGPHHTHIWHLQSLVLCGRLTHYEWRPRASVKTGPYALYRIAYDGRRNAFIPEANGAHLDLAGEPVVVSAGQAYSFPAGQFHTVDADPGTITICIAEHTQEPGPFVAYPDGDGPQEMTRPALTPAECRTIVGTAIRSLG